MNTVNLKDYLYFTYEIVQDGKSISKGKYRMEENIPAQEEILLENGCRHTRWTEDVLKRNQDMEESEIQVMESPRNLIIKKGEKCCYRFNKLNGLFEQMKKDGKELLDKPMEVNIWRAPTDNDRKIKEIWYQAHYDQSYARAY